MVKKYLLRVILLCSVVTLSFNKVSAQYAQSGSADPNLLKSIYWLTFGTVNKVGNTTYSGDGTLGPDGTGSTLISVVPADATKPYQPDAVGNGVHGGSIPNGVYTWQFSPTVRIEATISGLTVQTFGNDAQTLRPYSPGSYDGDGLGALFNNLPKASNSNNTSLTGIPFSGMCSPPNAQASFNIAIRLLMDVNHTGSYQPISYPGMVVADAESVAGSNTGEFWGAEIPTGSPSTLKFQLLSRIWTGAHSTTTADADQYVLTLSGGSTKFKVSTASGAGNSGSCGVLFAAGSTSFQNVTVRGEGIEAVALGFIIPFDLGDAPASYGFAGNYINNFDLTNAFQADNTYPIRTLPTAALVPKPRVFIGTASTTTGVPTVDPDGQQIGNTYASGDDSTYVNDENTFTGSNKPASIIKVNQNGDFVFTLPSVTNNGIDANNNPLAGKLYAWVDYNYDGKFSADEEQEVVLPAGSTTSYTFTYLNARFKNTLKAGPLYARFRVTTASITDDIGTTSVDERATNYVYDGETEDYRFDVPGITISGSVYDDGNGNKNSLVDGTAVSTVITSGTTTTPLYAYLANGTGQSSILLQKVQVTNGAFSFTGVNNGTYTVAISTNNITPDPNGTTPPTLASVPNNLPNTYVATGASYGTNNTGHATDELQTGTANLQITVTTPSNALDVSGLKFGLDVVPVAKDDAATSASPSILINVPANDIDPEGLDKSTVLLIDPADNTGNTKSASVTIANQGTYTVITTVGSADLGKVTFTPVTAFISGTSTIKYTIKDNAGVESNQATITVTASGGSGGGNTGTPQSDVYPGKINTPVTYDVKNNDGDNNKTATVNLPTSSTSKGGTVVNDGADKVTYTPPPNFVGTDTYTYTLTLNGTTTSPVTNTVQVAPIGISDFYSTTPGVVIANPVKENDGPSANGTTVAIGTAPTHGSLSTFNGGNSFFYTPTPNNPYIGSDTYTYTLTKDGVTSAPITVNINIVAASTTTGNDDADVTKINTPKATIVKANDGASFTNATVTPTATTSTKGGSVTNDGNGVLIYTPPTNFIGTDTYTYTLTNSGSTPTAPITVTMVVKPVGVMDIYTTNVDKAITSSVKDNDGASAANTTVAVVTQPVQGGTVTANSDNTITFTPKAGFVGTDTYTYKLTTSAATGSVSSDPITVVINIANSGTTGTLTTGGTPDMDVTTDGVAKITNVRANDGTSNNTATVTPQAGKTVTGGATLSTAGDGTITYTPVAGFVGKDSYTYTLSTATQPITVNMTVKPVGKNDNYSTTKGVAVANTVKDNDGDNVKGSTFKVALVTPPSYGTVAPDNTNTSFTYTPNTNFTGTDSYTYAIVTPDGVYSDPITVINTVSNAANTGANDLFNTPINTPADQDVKANDGDSFKTATVNVQTDPTTKGGTVVNDGADKIIYTPPTNFIGRDGYTYTLTNSGTTTPKIGVVVLVQPVGVNDFYSTTPGVAITNTVKDNDGASGNGTTLAVGATQPAHGSVTVTTGNANTFTYTPNDNVYVGTDTYTYTLTTTDNVPSAPITVTINIVAASTTTGNTDADITKINTPKVTNVKANDGSTFTNATVTPTGPSTKGGTVTNDGSGNLIYTSPSGFIGKDTYTYTLTNSGGTPTAPITVTMAVKPVGMRDIYSTNVNTPVLNDVKTNDGPSATGTTVSIVTQPIQGGTVTPNGANTAFTYTPKTGYVGTDTYTYTLTTTDGVVSDPITVVVNIANAGVNGTLSTGGTPDTDVTLVGTPKTTNVKANDGTANANATVTPQSGTTTKGGTVANDGSGNIIYTPAVGYTGKDTYTYTLTNGSTTTSSIPVSISVRPVGVNDNYTTGINTAVSNPVTSNDGASATGNTVVIVSPPTYGTVTANGTNAFTYTPANGFTGTDIYTYSLVTPDGIHSAPITVTNTVTKSTSCNLTGLKVRITLAPGVTSASAVIATHKYNKIGTMSMQFDDGSRGISVADTIWQNFTYTDGAGMTRNYRGSVGLNGGTGVPGSPGYVATYLQGPELRALIAKNYDIENHSYDHAGISYADQSNYSTAQKQAAAAAALASATKEDNIIYGFAQYKARSFIIPTNYAYYDIAAQQLGYISAESQGVDPFSIPPSAQGFVPDALGPKPDFYRLLRDYNDDWDNPSTLTFFESQFDKLTNGQFNTYLLFTHSTLETANKKQNFTTLFNYFKSHANDQIGFYSIREAMEYREMRRSPTCQQLDGNVLTITVNVDSLPARNRFKDLSFNVTSDKPITAVTVEGFDSADFNPATGLVNVFGQKTVFGTKPTGVNDSYGTAVGTPVLNDVRSNDGPSAAGATVSISTQPTHGTVVANSTNTTFTYTPTAGYTGTDTYTYVLTTTDGSVSDPITVTITISNTGVQDNDITKINTPVTTDVRANDGPNYNNATVTPTPTTTKGGSTTVDAITQKVTYTPPVGFTGIDTYTYTLTNSGSTPTTPVTVYIAVKPVGVNDNYSTAINSPVVNDVKSNDGASATGTTVTVVTAPAHGTVVANSTNTSFTYTPANGYTGTDTYTYTLTTADGVISDPITVTISIVTPGVNGTPDTDITFINTPKTTNVKANDGSNYASATVTPTPTTTKGGTTSVDNTTGNVTYTPPSGFVGKDTYTYTLTNGSTTTPPIAVTINVKPVGVTDNFTTSLNVPVPNDVKANDGASATGTTVAVVTTPLHGTLTPNSTNTSFTYTPTTGYIGTDTYTYALVTNDGVTSDPITVNLSISSSVLILNKVANNGASLIGDVISYTLTVGNTSTTAITNVRVTDAGADAGSISPANIATIAAGSSATVTAKHTVTAADVAAGSYSNQASVTATDINGNPVSKPKSDNPNTPAVDDPTVVAITPKGAISLVKTGVSDFTSVTFTFTITNTGNLTLSNISLTDALLNISNSPITVTGGLAPGKSTTATFKYTLLQADRDASKVVNSATINATDANNNPVTNTSTITVTVPPSPKATPDPVSIPVGQTTTIVPSKNDQVSGAAFVAIEILTQPQHGTLKVNPDLTVTYIPTPGYSGPDSFTYRLRDLNGFYTNAAAVAISDGFVNNLTIPNTFTPNGDGINDTFEIIGIENYPINELIIVNRWGNEVYHKSNYTKEWTGEGLNEGTYYFLLHLKASDGSDIEVIKGYVSLIRNKVN